LVIEELGPKLTPRQAANYRDLMRAGNDPTVKICRFLYHGRALDIQTGELASPGSNVIYHRHYWNWDRETARALAKDLGEGVKVVWSN